MTILMLRRGTKNGIAVFNTPNIMNHAVADLTIGLIIAISRKICLGNNIQKIKTDREFLGFILGR